MKECTYCHQIKPLDEFPRDKRALDGRTSRCNDCMSLILKAYRTTEEGRTARLESQRRYQSSEKGQTTRQAWARTEKARTARRTYAHTEKGANVMRASRKKYRQKMKETELGRRKLQAEMAVRHAIERGELAPAKEKFCARCGGQAEEYHHDLGYSPHYWLHVVPVCRHCHHTLHHGAMLDVQ